MHLYIYIYIYIYIYATALCASGVTGLQTLHSDFLHSNFLQPLILGPPRSACHKVRSARPDNTPPWAGFEKHCFCHTSLLIFTFPPFEIIDFLTKTSFFQYIPANIHFFTFLQKHNMLQFKKNHDNM